MVDPAGARAEPEDAPSDLASRVTGIANAAAAATADSTTWGRLARDAQGFAQAIASNAGATARAAQALAVDCQTVLGATPAAG